ncbi:MAG: hypothetical protein PVH61_23835 [Candidatus Aminicenantes bacterium]|jgi:hypothetical protein
MVMKRWFTFFVVLLMVSMGLMGKKLATIADIFRPFMLAMDDQQLYVTEGTTVSIFSRNGFTLKKKFGNEGEGPQEFKLVQGVPGLILYLQTDSLVINSAGKVSSYSKDGTFIKEMKVPTGSMVSIFQPLGEKFVGGAASMGENMSMSFTLNIYDSQLTKIKEIYQLPMMQRGRMEFPTISPIFFVVNNKIIIGGQKEFVINILNAKGDKISSISRDYKLLKVTEDYRKGIHDYFKTNPATKQTYEFIKNMITFGEYFPAIQGIYVDNQKIYIQTYMKKEEKYECFIYEVNGKFLQRLFLPVKYMNALMPNPTTIKDNTLYQLVENEDEENWELHAHPIK